MIWLCALAFADAREDLEDALLARAFGDRDTAQRTLTRLRRSLAADDPLRGLALFWSATIHEELGQRDSARTLLRECVRLGPSREDCIDLLGRLELESSAMKTPGRWTFSGDHGVVHLWSQWDQGTVSVVDEGGNAALRWESRRIPESPGTLLFAVEPVERPRRLGMTLRADAATALLVVFMDHQGAVHRARAPIVLEPGRTRRVELALDEVTGLRPDELERVVIRDVSSTRDVAKTVVWMDDVRVW